MTTFTLPGGYRRHLYVSRTRAKINAMAGQDTQIPRLPVLVIREDDINGVTVTYASHVEITGPAKFIDGTAPGAPPLPTDKGPGMWVETTAALVVTI